MAAAGLQLAAGKLRKRVLVHAGGIEAVGLAAVQLAKASGADVYVTAGGRLRAHLEALGASYVSDGKGMEVAQEVLSLTGGEGVGILVCAPEGSEALEASLSCLAPRGCFLEVAAQKSSSAHAVEAARPDVSYFRLAFDEWMVSDTELLEGCLDRLTEGFSSGALTALPTRAYPLTSVEAAWAAAESGAGSGEIALTMDSASIRPGASYLITGGLGTLGVVTAQWLARQGAGHVVLAGP